MIEQIYNEDVLREEIEKNERLSVAFSLDEQQIKEWKEKGNFSFLKREMRNLPKVKFACMQHEDGDCSYYFIMNTEKLTDRVLFMLSKLYLYNKHIPLTSCEYSDDKGGKMPRYGSIKACSLFS